MNVQKEKGAHKAVKNSERKSHGVSANIGQMVEMVNQAIKEGGEKVREIGSNADRKLKDNPWTILTGAALLALSVGYIIGGSRKH